MACPLLIHSPQSDSAGGIGLLERAPYSQPRRVRMPKDFLMSQLARLIQIAGVLMAIVFFTVALRG